MTEKTNEQKVKAAEQRSFRAAMTNKLVSEHNMTPAEASKAATDFVKKRGVPSE